MCGSIDTLRWVHYIVLLPVAPIAYQLAVLATTVGGVQTFVRSTLIRTMFPTYGRLEV